VKTTAIGYIWNIIELTLLFSISCIPFYISIDYCIGDGLGTLKTLGRYTARVWLRKSQGGAGSAATHLSYGLLPLSAPSPLGADCIRSRTLIVDQSMT
jgi:hypothetical protein